MPVAPTLSHTVPRLRSGSGWPPTASITLPSVSSPQTIVTGAIRGRCRSAPLTWLSTAAGRGSNAAAVLAVWRTSDVSAAAATPIPVTSEQQHLAALDREHVVEVAADVRAALTRPVVGGEAPAGHVRQLLGQQARLQRARDLGALRVEPRVLDRARAARGELLRERKVVRGVEAA